ncbi:hypothetical protein [Dactylosporangium cerinum]
MSAGGFVARFNAIAAEQGRAGLTPAACLDGWRRFVDDLAEGYYDEEWADELDNDYWIRRFLGRVIVDSVVRAEATWYVAEVEAIDVRFREIWRTSSRGADTPRE